ncbi:MAG TPA: M43 family zinc metalloprotease [Bacteroidia bacterium]|nr:M43 family zinc metalloprotease [Bacteroidia bacterium]
MAGFGTFASSPDQRKTRCATVDYVNKLKAENPNYLENKLIDKKILEELEADQSLSRVSNVIHTIPVVVHVIYKTTAQNISDAQILSQIQVLNEDFGRRNPDTTHTPSFWSGIAATTNFQFCLAKQDPSGNPTTGIERRVTTTNSFSTSNNMKHYSSGGLDAWDVNRYFNIWVCNLGSFLLGYAEPPSSVHSDEYGVVILYDAFGRIGTVSSPYDLGRTTTHEIGHAFGMEHIWGDDNDCSGSDGIADTPDQEIETYDCPVTVPMFDGCTGSGNGIMYMNYMDYTDDACMNMFTVGQANRMNLLMGAFYPTLLVSTACEDVTGINEASNNFSFSIYPNPSSGLVKLDMYLMENIGSGVNLYVSDMLGRSVLQESISNPSGQTHDLDLRDQDAGIYFVTLFNDNYRRTVRLEINK